MSLDKEKIKIFLKVYKDLLEKMQNRDKADSCRQIDPGTTQSSKIQAGEKNSPPDPERKFVGIYHINVNLIYYGGIEMFWTNDPIRKISVINKDAKKDKKKKKGKFRSLENADGDIDLNMN